MLTLGQPTLIGTVVCHIYISIEQHISAELTLKSAGSQIFPRVNPSQGPETQAPATKHQAVAVFTPADSAGRGAYRCDSQPRRESGFGLVVMFAVAAYSPHKSATIPAVTQPRRPASMTLGRCPEMHPPSPLQQISCTACTYQNGRSPTSRRPSERAHSGRRCETAGAAFARYRPRRPCHSPASLAEILPQTKTPPRRPRTLARLCTEHRYCSQPQRSSSPGLGCPNMLQMRSALCTSYSCVVGISVVLPLQNASPRRTPPCIKSRTSQRPAPARTR
jgi:hypothetical protein